MVKSPSNVIDSGEMMPSMSKTKFWKLAKEAKNLIFWKHDYSKFQTKWDILFTNMGLSDRHFISQPLEQRIITIWNKIKFSDFRNNKYWNRKISQGNHPWDEVLCGNREAKTGDHIHFVGEKKCQKEGLAENNPLDPTWMVPFFISITTNNFISGVISLRNFRASNFFLVISEIRKLSFVANWDYSLF